MTSGRISWHSSVVKALAAPEVRRRLEENSYVPIGSSPDEFAQFIKKDLVHQAEIAKQIGIKPQ